MSRTVPLSPEQVEAIEQAARDYFEGWFEGDPDRMSRCLHPRLAKRNIDQPDRFDSPVDENDWQSMVDGAREGRGTKYRGTPFHISITRETSLVYDSGSYTMRSVLVVACSSPIRNTKSLSPSSRSTVRTQAPLSSALVRLSPNKGRSWTISAPAGAVPTTCTDGVRTTSPSSGEVITRMGVGVGSGEGVCVGVGLGVGELPRQPDNEAAT
jgi:hypothetical protein